MNKKRWQNKRTNKKKWKSYEQTNFHSVAPEESRNSFYGNNYYQFETFQNFSRPPPTISYHNLMNENPWNLSQQLPPSQSRVPISHQWRPPPPPLINEPRLPATCTSFFQNTQNKISSTSTIKPPNIKVQHKPENDSRITLEGPLKSPVKPRKTFEKSNIDPPSLKLKPNILSSLKNTRLPQNLDKNKLLQIVNSSTTKFEPAMRELVRQKRLQLSRDLRNKYSSQTSTDQTNDILIPDIDIDLNSLPPQIISKLNNVLEMQNCDKNIPVNLDLKSEYEQFDNEMMLTNNYNNLISSSSDLLPSSFFLLKNEENISESIKLPIKDENNTEHNDLKENCGALLISNEKTSDNIDDLFTLSNYGIELPSDVDELQLPSDESSLFNFTEIIKDLPTVDPFSKDIITKRQLEVHDQITIETTNLSPIKKIVDIKDEKNVQTLDENDKKQSCITERTLTVNNINDVDNNGILGNFRNEDGEPSKEMFEEIIIGCNKNSNEHSLTKERKHLSQKNESVFTKEIYEKTDNLSDRNKVRSELNSNGTYSEAFKEAVFSHPNIHEEPENENQSAKINSNSHLQSKEYELVTINCDKIKEHDVLSQSPKNNGLLWPQINKTTNKDENKEALKMTQNNLDEPENNIDTCMKSKINFFTENLNAQTLVKSVEDIKLKQNFKQINKSDTSHKELVLVSSNSDIGNINLKKRLSPSDDVWKNFKESCAPKPLKQRLNTFRKHLDAEVKGKVLVVRKKKYKVQSKRRKTCDRKSKSNKNTNRTSCTLLSKKKTCEVMGFRKISGKLHKKLSDTQKKPKKNFKLENEEYDLKVTSCDQKSVLLNENSICNEISVNYTTNPGKTNHSDLTSETKTTGNTNNLKEINFKIQQLADKTIFLTDHFLNNKSTEKNSIMENTKTDVSDNCFEFHKNEITEQNTSDKTDEKLKNFKLETSEFIVEKMNGMNHQIETISKQNIEFSKSMIGIKTKENTPNNIDNENFRNENTINNKNSVSHVQVDDINKLLSEKDNSDKYSIDLKKAIKSKISESDSDKISEILQFHNTAGNYIVNVKYNKNIYDNENVTEHKKKSQNTDLLSFDVSHVNTDLDYSEIDSDQLYNDSSSETKNILTNIVKTKNCNHNIVMNNLGNIKSTNSYHNSDNINNSHIYQENNTIEITSNEKVDVDLNLKNICPIPVQELKENNINKTKTESQVIVEDGLKKNSTDEQELNENCLTVITHSDNEQKCKKKIENDQCSHTKKSEKTQIKKERNQLPEKPEYSKNKYKKHSSHKSNDKLFISASKSKESQVKKSFVSEDVQVSNTPNNDIKIHSSIFENEEILNRLIYIDVEIKKLLDEKFLLYKQLLNRTNSENDNIIKIINNMQISTLTQKDKTSLMNDSLANSEKKQIIKESLAEVNNRTVKNNLNFKYEFSDKGLKRPSSTCSEYSIKTSNKHSYKIHNRASSEDKFIKTTEKKYKDKKYTESDKNQNIKHISSKDKLQFDTLKRKCMSDFELKLNKKKIKLGIDEINKKSEHSKTYENRKQVKEEKTSHCRKESKRKYDKMDAESIIANSTKQNNKQDKLPVKECKNKNKLYTSNIVPSFSNETVFNKKIAENKNINKNYSRKNKNMTLNLRTEDFKSVSNKIKTESVPLANTKKEKKDNSFDTQDLKHKVAKENKNCDLHLKDLKLNNEYEKGSNSVINSKHDTYQTNDHSNESVEKKNILKGKSSEVYINHAKSANKLNLTKGKLQDTDFQTEPQIDGKKVKTELDTTYDNQVNKQLDNNCLNERNLKTHIVSTLKKCSELNLPRDTLNKIGSNIKNPSREDKYRIKDCFIKLIPLENLKISEKIMNKHTNNMKEKSQINKESVDLSNVNIFMSKNNSNKGTTSNETTIKSNKKQLPQKDDLSQNLDTNSSNEKHNLFVHLDVSKNNCKAPSEIKEAISHTKKIDQIIEEESNNPLKSNSDSFTSQKSTIDSVIESTQNIENLKKVENIKDEVFVREIEKIKRISDKEETVDSISHVEEIDLTEENIDLTNGAFDSHVGSILFAKIYHNYLIVACEDGKLYKYNLQNGKLLAKGVGHTSAITCFNLIENQSKDNIDTMIYSSSLDGSFRCFALETMEQISVSLKTDSPIQCMDTCWGFFFLGSNSGHLYRYIIQSEKLADEKREIADKPILVLKATREGSRRVLIVAPRTYPVSIRDAISGLLLRYVTRAPSPTVYSILLSDSLVYCGTSQNLIIGYDFTNGVSSIQYTAGRGIVCLAIHKKMLFAGCYDGQVYIFNLKSQEFIISLPGPGSMILALDIVDDKIIVGCKNSKIGIIEMPEIVKESFDSKKIVTNK